MENADLINQQQLVEAISQQLAARFNQPVEKLETHISVILLVDDRAYKIKKPMDFGFLDFTSLSKRRHFCEEELRLNRRLAPTIYRRLIAISGTPQEPLIDNTEHVIEYMLEMQRFESGQLFSELLERQQLDYRHIDELADLVARFHEQLTETDQANEQATVPVEASAVTDACRQNFAQLEDFVATQADSVQTEFSALRHWTEQHNSKLAELLQQRLQDGFVRECHGDMHLGNITLHHGKVVVFDGIEFNQSFRWIDVISEIAFVTMDLDDHQRSDLGWRLLNRYLESSGDYDGLRLLRYYQVYRAMVRAKISALRLQQLTPEDADYDALQAAFRDYLALASGYTRPGKSGRSGRSGRPRLLMTHGLSGSGKSYVSQALLQQLGLVRLRSDVERQRLFSDPGERYSAAASEATYARLHQLAAILLRAGFSVIIDATYLEKSYRQQAHAVAQENNASLHIMHADAPIEVLEQRIRQRQQAGQDASEADIAVLHRQRDRLEPLDADEQSITVKAGETVKLDDIVELLAGAD